MSAATYTRIELLRTVRSVRFFILSLVFPLVLFLTIAGANRHARVNGVGFPLYYMSGMVAWGSMIAVIGIGARIAAERSVGWNRQLRITPLTTFAYFRAKVLTGYFMASLTMLLLFAAGTSLDVRLPARSWAIMIGLVLVGLIPFVVLGILLGHVLTVDSMGPAMGGLTSLLALLGGAFGPIARTGFLLKLVEFIPSYWLVQAGKTAQGGSAWPLKGWLVMAAWTLLLTHIAVRVYQRDTKRI